MGFLVRSVRIHAIAALFIVFAPALPAWAQTGVAIRGTVRDASGGVLAGVGVDALVAGRPVAATSSDGGGGFDLTVPAGVPFLLRARLDGFTEYVSAIDGVTSETTHDVVMAVGSLSDTVVVTASRGVDARTSVTQTVSTLTRADLEALGSTDLSSALRFVPGTSVEGPGREGAAPTSLFVRGGDSDYNVVLIDGVRVNQDGGAFDFSRVAAGEIERVEMVRGAQSALWGADAMTSVVQIFTRGARPAGAPRLSASFEGGSFETVRSDAGVNGGAGQRADYHAHVVLRRTTGAFPDLLPEADRFRQTAVSGGVGLSMGARASARLGVRYSDADGRSVGPITFGARDTGGISQTRDLSIFGTLSHALGARFTGVATANYYRFRGLSADRTADPAFGTYAILAGTPGALYPDGTRLVRFVDEAEFTRLTAAGALPAPGQFLASAQSFDFPFNPAGCETATPDCYSRFRRPSLRYQGDYLWARGQRLTVGYDWERETNPGVDDFDLDNHGVFVQQQLDFGDRWFITVGARVDSKERYDTYVSPRLSAGGYVVPFRRGMVSSVKVFGNAGRGVKSPTFSERFGGAFADPNPDITVEQATSRDLGVETTFADQRLRATAIYFHNDFTDQISYRFGAVGDGIPEYVNIDGSRARGLELELGTLRPFFGFTADGTYSYVRSEVVTNQSTSQQYQPGQPLLRRPRHSGSLRAAYAFGPATVHGNLRLIGDRFDNSFLFLQSVPNAERPTSVTTDITINPGYAVASLGLDVRAHESVVIYVRGDNIGGTEYDFALGYPGLPRAVVAGVRVQFGPGR